jgi:hypothetical protein
MVFFKRVKILHVVKWAVALLGIATFGCNTIKLEGWKTMQKPIADQIREANPNDDGLLDRMAVSVVENGYREVAEVVRLTHVDTEPTKGNAERVLLRLGPIAITPLIESIQKDDPGQLVWDLQTALLGHIKERTRIVGIFEGLLADRRDVPVANPFTFKDEQPIKRRVCDDVYLMLRHLVSFKESEEERFLNENAFLKMRVSEKDSEISRFQKSKEYISLMEK